MTKQYTTMSIILLTVILAFTSATARASLEDSIAEKQIINHYIQLPLPKVMSCLALATELKVNRHERIILSLLEASASSIDESKTSYWLGYWTGKIEGTTEAYRSVGKTNAEIHALFNYVFNNTCVPKQEI